MGSITEDNPKGAALLGLNIAFFVLALAIVVLRLVTRFHLTRITGGEDICIVIALLFSLGQVVAVTLQVKYGTGRPDNLVSEQDTIDGLKPFLASIIVYNGVINFTKLSILLQYLRIFIQRWFRIACYALIGVVTVYSLWMLFSTIFLCYPVQRFWDKTVPGTCVNSWMEWFFNIAVNIITDFAIILLPMPLLNKLQLPKRQKIALMGVFALGGFVCLVSIIRLHFLVRIYHDNGAGISDNILAAAWSAVEANVAIICASLPSLKACISRLFPRFFTITGDRTYTYNITSGKNTKSMLGTDQPRHRERVAPHLRSQHDADFANEMGVGGTGLYGQKSFIKAMRGSDEDVELDQLPNGNSPFSNNQINVVTVVEQAYENKDGGGRSVGRSGGSDSESEKYLFHKDSQERIR